jgi:hypothetical protein
MTGGATARLLSPPAPAPPTRAYTRPVPLAGPQELMSPGQPRSGRMRPRSTTMLAASGAALVAGLAGWLVAAGSGAPATTPARHPAATGPPAPARARTVDVTEAALAGQPVSAVVRQLRQLGLQPQVTWITATEQAPGTVVSVQPAGQVPSGSTVTVTGALKTGDNGGTDRGGGHGHGHGAKGNGD